MKATYSVFRMKDVFGGWVVYNRMTGNVEGVRSTKAGALALVQALRD